MVNIMRHCGPGGSPKFRCSPGRFLLSVILIVFLAEAGIMLVLPHTSEGLVADSRRPT